jgi:hypothetical protein
MARERGSGAATLASDAPACARPGAAEPGEAVPGRLG